MLQIVSNFNLIMRFSTAAAFTRLITSWRLIEKAGNYWCLSSQAFFVRARRWVAVVVSWQVALGEEVFRHLEWEEV